LARVVLVALLPSPRWIDCELVVSTVSVFTPTFLNVYSTGL
jgi:hypothetical protein